MAKVDQELSNQNLKKMVFECLKQMIELDPELHATQEDTKEITESKRKSKNEKIKIVQDLIFVISGEYIGDQPS
jgi:hypothetical protein